MPPIVYEVAIPTSHNTRSTIVGIIEVAAPFDCVLLNISPSTQGDMLRACDCTWTATR